MSKFWNALFAFIFFCMPLPALAEQLEEIHHEATEAEIQKIIDDKLAQLHLQMGKIALPGEFITLSLPPEFGYLNPDQADILLHEVWGNPPSPGKSFGIIMPAPLDVASPNTWAVLLEYSADGHVNDDEAEKIDYAALLKEMQAATEAQNETRKQNPQNRYPDVHLLGWAEKPHYDATSHKLYWAREFSSSNSPEHTVNYDIRVLGRQGVLTMSIIGSMEQLPMIRANRDKLLSYVEFNPKHRYADFNPKTDKLATYGLGALILGTIVTKTGLLKGIIFTVVALKNYLLIAAVAATAFFSRLRSRRKKPPTPGPET